MKEASATPLSGPRIFVRTQAAPGVLERLLQPFTVLGLVPERLVVRRNARGLFVVLDVSGLESEKCRTLVWRLRQMPCMRGARLASRSLVLPLPEMGAMTEFSISRSAA